MIANLSVRFVITFQIVNFVNLKKNINSHYESNLLENNDPFPLTTFKYQFLDDCCLVRHLYFKYAYLFKMEISYFHWPNKLGSCRILLFCLKKTFHLVQNYSDVRENGNLLRSIIMRKILLHVKPGLLRACSFIFVGLLWKFRMEINSKH